MTDTMGIKFPSMHIAASVANRILNIADEIDDDEATATAALTVPSIPATQGNSLSLDMKLAAPIPDVAAPPSLVQPGPLE